ncbi:NAD(P)H-hydrate dehydratase [Bacillus tamaricis]|uniref:ADP-dependent (S)-NAD(P)H-hydrate dehydratase n=1 Tax=Evansella tamaricis TaxID=2069301 RepID=A0ABS6J9S1_9BACI|nr:NAD(P)H-hydrate dehydratase [Evansella tamaricis]
MAILIGTGNNGGDGFVIGRSLKESGYEVDVFLIPPEEKIRGMASNQKRIFERVGYTWIPYKNVEEQMEWKLQNYTVVIDALLGTGIKGTPRSPYKEIIELVNKVNGRIISVDVPSGIPVLEVDDSFDGSGIKADETYTFQAPKITNFIFPFAPYFGDVKVLDIGIPKKALEKHAGTRKLIIETIVQKTLPNRKPNAHKGSNGKALIIGGSQFMPGAPILTTNACLRSGTGLTTLAVPEEILPIVSQNSTEATFRSLPSLDGEIKTNNLYDELSLNLFYGIAIGPGMGRRNEYSLFESFEHYEGLLVIDADGLFHLSKELPKWKGGRRAGPTIITPHTGEMGRLTGLSTATIEKHRFEVSKTFAKTFGMYVVLKGPYTIVTSPSGMQWVNQSGNPSLAKGGSGDVLTGIILGFLLQHQSILEALCNAVFIHGKTADKLVKTQDGLSVTATDILGNIGKIIHSTRYHS